MKLNQLKNFAKIVEAGSLSKAAINLGVAQPALSQHVASLEQLLGVALLERSSRGVVCTPAGELLYEHARTILRQVELAEYDVRNFRQSPSGEVVVMLASTVAPLVTAPLAAEVARRFPDINLLINEEMSVSFTKIIENGKADLAFVPGGTLPAGVDSELLLIEDIYFGGKKGCDGDEDGPIDFEEACRYPLVLPTRPHYTRNTLEQAAFDRGLTLKIRGEQDSPRLLRGLVKDGYGYSMLPENSFLEHMTEGSVFVRKVENPNIRRSMHLIWTRTTMQNRVTAAVKAILRDVVIDLCESGNLRGELKITRAPLQAGDPKAAVTETDSGVVAALDTL